MSFMELDLIDLFIEDDDKDKSGVTATATVDSPAIEQGYFAFNKQTPKNYKIQLGSQKGAGFTPVSADKQILAGALMIPDMPIYRVDDDTKKEYNVRFTSQTIEQIVKKFSRLHFNTNINEMHDPNKMIKGAYMYQWFIINRELGVMPPLNQDHLPDGTWFGFVYVGDKNVWDNFIKTGIYTGFSVEGNFYEQPVTPSTPEFSDEALNAIYEVLK